VNNRDYSAGLDPIKHAVEGAGTAQLEVAQWGQNPRGGQTPGQGEKTGEEKGFLSGKKKVSQLDMSLREGYRRPLIRENICSYRFMRG